MYTVCFWRGVRFAALPFIILGFVSAAPGQVRAQAAVKDVLKTYADIAHAGYEDSLITARTLQAAIETFLGNPNEQTLIGARAAWLAAREPLPADRGLPLRQRGRRRLGGQGERLASG